jgi:hypothetical protein
MTESSGASRMAEPVLVSHRLVTNGRMTPGNMVGSVQVPPPTLREPLFDSGSRGQAIT